ncbi:MAG: DUF4910 domain-containing protein, partial [Candidatus Eiseniibacteriota bacterium]
MLEDLIQRLKDEVSGARALESVRAIARFHRVQASPGLDAASQWLASECERIGLEVALEHVSGDGRTRHLGHLMPQGWECTRAVAWLHDGQARRSLCDYGEARLALILRSAPARGRYAIVGVEAADRAESYAGRDVRGRVVLTDRDVHRVHELAVVERGAAGLLSYGRRQVPPVRIEGTDPDALAYTSFWWNEHEPRGWGFVISPRVAAGLLERLAAGAALELEAEIESRAFDTRIPLVVASQRGPSRGEEIVVVSHLCHPEPSANDNASGAAANLEAARALAALGVCRKARRRVRHLWMPEFTGTYAWLGLRASAQAPPPIAALNLDMVGEDQSQCGSTFLIEQPPCWSGSFAESLLAQVRERAVDRWPLFGGGATMPSMKMGEVNYSGGSDHTAFLDPALGVPCPMMIQWPDRYYHSSYDTPERCDPASLALAARCAAAYAGFLAGAGVREWSWLAREVALRARSRLLDAVRSPQAGRATEAELLRAERALASVAARAGSAATRRGVAAQGAALRRFWTREVLPALPRAAETQVSRARAARRSRGGGARVPVRAIGAPIHYQRWMLPGWDRLESSAREAWRAAEAGPEDLAPIHELAWSLADGRRTLAAIERLVWLETGRSTP